MNHIPKIVVTGGPCAGKTTLLAKLTTWCLEHGYEPLIVPEAATAYITGGIDPRSAAFQELVMRFVMTLEETFEIAAAGLQKPVIIYDRGLFDQKAYTGQGEFDRLCAKLGVVPEEALQGRYAGVIFLDSAAKGAEAFYSNKSNPTRYESLEEARALNDRTHAAWMGVPHLITIENRKDQAFDEKMSHAVRAIARLLGEPEPLEAERKFLLGSFDPAMLPAHAAAVDIVQTYLVGDPGLSERVRARGQNGYWAYTHTIKEPRGPGISAERERRISRGEYEGLLIRRDTGRLPVYKTRHCFAHEGHYCELDVFLGHRSGLVVLEIETPAEDRRVSLPPYLSIVREVTHDPSFASYMLSKAA